MTVIFMTIAAGAGTFVPIDEDDRFEKRSFNIDILLDETDCGVLINGKSMEPIFPDGCIAWVSTTDGIKYVDDVIEIVNGVLLCKIYEEEGLHSYNPDFPTIHIDDDDNINFLGKVIGYYTE